MDQTLLQTLAANGLTTSKADDLLRLYGENTFVERERQSAFSTLIEQFKSPLVIMLFIAAVISFFSGSRVSALLMIVIILVSAVVNFYVSFKSQKAAEHLAQKIKSQARVFRDGMEMDLPVNKIVPGDIVRVDAGNIIPADGIILWAEDFFVNESSLTGESFPIEKEKENEVYLGSGVVTGDAIVQIGATGVKTKFYSIVALLSEKERPNEFETGIKKFSYLIARVVIVMTVIVFIVNALLKHNIFDSLIFSLALAVGLTPELLPLIIATNLSKASIKMASKGVIVKKLSSIESFGGMDMLCTDKTGTLTQDKITVIKCVDIDGKESEDVFASAYIACAFHTGTKTPLDDAIREFKGDPDLGYKKIDEIPFDFERRRNSVVAEKNGEHFLISKGAPESILGITTLSATEKAKALQLFEGFSGDGFRVLGIASKNISETTPALKATYDKQDEKDITFLGFIAFVDPPKLDVKEVLTDLEKRGISVKIITGDHSLVAKKVAKEVGFTDVSCLEGDRVDALNDAELAIEVEKASIFARVTPVQKNRIITILKANGHVVGYMGDGINDAPALRSADVGISVSNAVDVAKEAADIILVEKSLRQLIDGVIEGRRTFANTVKYINMSISSNFGNMFSMTGASFILPFLPMLPVQLLLNNLLYESSQFALTFDTVDDEVLNKPRPWDLAFIKRFMIVFGTISSVFDFITFFILYKIFSLAGPSFQTGWFIESFATQVLVIFMIRTSKTIWKAKPAHILVKASAIISVTIAWGIALSFLGKVFGFVPIPNLVIAYIAVIVVLYLAVIEAAKARFYKTNSYGGER